MKSKDFKYINFYDYVIKVLSICKIGKIFSTDPYAIENYTELEKLSMKMLDHFDELTFDKPNIFLRNVYPTPSVSCRCVIFNAKDEVLFIQESEDETFGLPGGRCDLYDSPKESIIKEITQEAGMSVEDLEFIGIINQTPHKKDYRKSDAPYDTVPEYALIFKAKAGKIIREHTHETLGASFYKIDEMPKLSRKLKEEDYKRIIKAALNNEMILD